MAIPFISHWPPALSDEHEQSLVSEIHDWSIAHGLTVRLPNSLLSQRSDAVLATPGPVTIFPSPFPRTCFEQALAIQTAYNALYAAIGGDDEWLAGVIEKLLDVDSFIARLWEIHLAVKKEGYVQDLSLGLFRSDYMIHIDPENSLAQPELKQVEFNTIASSMGCLADKASQMHRYLSSISTYPISAMISEAVLAPNHAISALSAGLASAHTSYGTSKSVPPMPTCIIFVVQSHEQNIYDQKHLEYCIQTMNQIPVFRVPFSQILDLTHVADDASRSLLYRPPHAPQQIHEVTVVYYRSGYSPEHYPSRSAWNARLQLERSAAIKCPSVLTHLAGCKKVQQVLATPSSPYLDRFHDHKNGSVEEVRATFTNMYPLDDSPAGREARRLALDPETAQRYVLKPQREGGGNNIYRNAIPAFLRSLPETHWKSYILMEIIEPPALRNSILRNGRVQSGEIICELGVFGVCLWQQKTQDVQRSGNAAEGQDGAQKGKEPSKSIKGVNIRSNYEAGYILRTKGRESEEGGIAAGFGCIDSCLLID